MNSDEKNRQEKIITPNTLAKNLLNLMEKNNVSESELSRALTIPYNTIRRITSGFTTDPRISTLKLIADYFNVDLDILIGKVSTAENKLPHMVPLLKWSDIADPDFLNKLDFSAWPRWQPIVLSHTETINKQTYGLESRVSMQPRFPLGTIFIIDPHQDPSDSDLVLVRIKANQAVSLRDLIIDPPSWQLLAINQHSSPLLYNQDEHEIIGIVVLIMIYTRKI